MTAAHCIQGKNKARINTDNCMVVLGITDLVKELPVKKDRKISEFIINPNWGSSSKYWHADISVGVLKNKIDSNEFYQPICLNSNSIDHFYNKQGTVTGWGSTNITGFGSSTIANEFSVTIIDNDLCRKETPGLLNLATSTAFCAGNVTRSAACTGKIEQKENFNGYKAFFEFSGDSGGTLFAVDVDDVFKYKAIGVVSVGLPGAEENVKCDVNKYQLYTNVANFYDWIMEIVFETY